MARQRQIDWDEVDDRPSKTEQKKAMQRLQQLGEQLVGLSEKKTAQHRPGGQPAGGNPRLPAAHRA